MVKKITISTPSEMSPDDRIRQVEERLKSIGVTSVHISFAAEVKSLSASEVKNNVARFFEAYLDGHIRPMMLLDVDSAETLAKRDNITVAQARKKYKNIPLSATDEEIAIINAVKPKTTVKRISRAAAAEASVGLEDLIKPARPNEGWPFPLSFPKKEEPK